jgi:hypothetical protein
MNRVTKKLCFYGKEQQSTALGTDTGKGRVKITDPCKYRTRQTQKDREMGEKGGRRCEYSGRIYEK